MQKVLLILFAGVLTSLMSLAGDLSGRQGSGSALSVPSYAAQLAVAQQFLRQNGIEQERVQIDEALKKFSLDLSKTSITDLSFLLKLTHLTQLNLSETGVRDLKPLSSLAALKQLRLHRTQVTDLEPLSGLEELTVLVLYKTPVRDLKALEPLKKLKAVNFGETKVSKKEIAAFAKSRPGLFLAVTDPSIY